jgi:hypothetical protein
VTDKTLLKLVVFILALPVVFAAGCEQKFRYPCQDPKNWETAQCQKPLCEVNRDCPDLIFKESAEAVGLPPIIPPKAPVCEKGCSNGK